MVSKISYDDRIFSEKKLQTEMINITLIVIFH